MIAKNYPALEEQTKERKSKSISAKDFPRDATDIIPRANISLCHQIDVKSRETTLSRSTSDSQSFRFANILARYHSTHVSPHVRENKQRSYAFLVKFIDFANRFRAHPHPESANRSGTQFPSSSLLKLSRKRITFGETNRPTGERARDKKRKGKKCAREERGIRMRSLSSTTECESKTSR